MDYLLLIYLTPIVLIVGIIFLLFLSHKLKPIIALVSVVFISILTSLLAIQALMNSPIVHTINLAGIFKDLSIRIDSLSAWFILIINFTVLNGIIYGIGYLKSYVNLKTNLSVHWIFLVIFHSSMLWVCMFEHGLAFLIAWELMSLSSLMLVLFEYQNKDTLKAGINYMIQMHVSVIFLTIGFIWLYIESNSFDFSSISNCLSSGSSIWLAMLLIIGFAIKAGFIPFHSWLPHAHPAAPSHVSGVMSGVIVKLGIYGIIRVLSNLQSNYIIVGEIIIVISIITAVYGITNAGAKYDYKRLLAYCTIENIGIIGIGIGVGLMGLGFENITLIILGFSGALLHTLNHSLFKSMLFFSAGNIYQQTHTRNMDKLGGLVKSMPQTAMFFLVGALAIGGLPPFNGFISEFIIYSGLIKGLTLGNLPQLILLIISIAGLAIVGGMSLHTFTKSYGVIFSGYSRTKMEHTPKEVSFIMRLPQYIIILVIFSIAFLPAIYYKATMNIVTSLFPLATSGILPIEVPIESTLQIIGLVSFLFTIFLVFIFTVRWLLCKNQPSKVDNTWGCGYVGSSKKMQYTGLSFSRSFTGLLNFFLVKKKYYLSIDKSDIFPKERSFKSFFIDLFEHYLISPILTGLRYFTNLFQFIQNGKIQTYVLYGILFIMLVFLGTLFNLI